MSLYSIASNLSSKEKKVFSNSEIKLYSGISANSTSEYIYRLIKKSLIYKIEKNKFAISTDPFIVGSQILFPSYISFFPAFYLYHFTDQTINELQIASSARKNNIIFNGMKIEFIYMKPELIFGYKKIKKDDSYIFLVDVKKLIIDIAYRPDIMGILPIGDIPLSRIKKKTLEIYLNKVKIEAVRRRVGYIMECLGMNLNIKPRNNSVYKLNPYNKNPGKYIVKWKLYDNEVNY